MSPIPDGWLDYERVGKQVDGTRFIAFKVPLTEDVNDNYNISPEEKLYPGLLVELVPNLGMVIDITNTAKYYSPEEFELRKIQHVKIWTKGKQIPNLQCYTIFREAIKKFLSENENNDKLIGVHCTHGLNRTGFLVCRYMIEELQIEANEAMSAFERARGHQMTYDHYKRELRQFTPQ